jgi:hypothetical protein
MQEKREAETKDSLVCLFSAAPENAFSGRKRKETTLPNAVW